MLERFAERRAEEALSDTPVVLIVGPRRAGKTTLVRKMGQAGRTYITLDDQTVLEAAQSDATGFIRGLDRAIIDEIQRAPDLLLAVVVQTFGIDVSQHRKRGLSYAARTAFQISGAVLPLTRSIPILNCPFLIRCISSTPAMTIDALRNRFIPSIGPKRSLIDR